jgi:hypothetical protein
VPSGPAPRARSGQEPVLPAFSCPAQVGRSSLRGRWVRRKGGPRIDRSRPYFQEGGGIPSNFSEPEEEFSLLPCRSALVYRIKTGSGGRKNRRQKMTCTGIGPMGLRGERSPGLGVFGLRPTRSRTPGSAYTIYTNKPYGTAYRAFGLWEFLGPGRTWTSWPASSEWLLSSSGC